MKIPSLWARLLGAQKSGRAADKENAVGRVPFLYVKPSGKKKAKAATGQPAAKPPVARSPRTAPAKPPIIGSRWADLSSASPESIAAMQVVAKRAVAALTKAYGGDQPTPAASKNRWRHLAGGTKVDPAIEGPAIGLAENPKALANKIFHASERSKPNAKAEYAKTPHGEMAKRIFLSSEKSRSGK